MSNPINDIASLFVGAHQVFARRRHELIHQIRINARIVREKHWNKNGHQQKEKRDCHAKPRQAVSDQAPPCVSPKAARRPSGQCGVLELGDRNKTLPAVEFLALSRTICTPNAQSQHPALCIPDARVYKCIKDVHYEIDGHKDEGNEKGYALDDRIITGVNGIHEPATDAGPRKDRFGQNGA